MHGVQRRLRRSSSTRPMEHVSNEITDDAVSAEAAGIRSQRLLFESEEDDQHAGQRGPVSRRERHHQHERQRRYRSSPARRTRTRTRTQPVSVGLADGVSTVDPVRHRINKLGHRHLVPSCDVSLEYSFKSSKSNMFVSSEERNHVLADEPDKRQSSGTGFDPLLICLHALRLYHSE